MKLFINALTASFKLNYKVSKALVILRMIIMIVIAFIPTIISYLIKIVTNMLAYPDIINTNIFGLSALGIFSIIIVLNVLIEIVNRLLGYFSTIHNDKINKEIDLILQEKFASFSFEQFEDPNFNDKITNIRNESRVLISYFWSFFIFIQVFIQFCTAFYAFKSFGYVYSIIILVPIIPVYICENKMKKQLHNWELSQVRTSRRMNYSYNCITNQSFFYVWKINDCAGFLIDKYKTEWSNYFNNKKKIYLKNTFILTFINLLPIIVYLLGAVLIITRIIKGELRVGEFTFYLSIANQLITSVVKFISNASTLSVLDVQYKNYTDFMNEESAVIFNDNKKINNIQTIEFKNVSFKYPRTDKYILKDINFKINSGEKIAIVGANGIGKTTIIKLLLRLYDCNSGEILINGKDIKSLDILKFYKDVSVIFQEHPLFAFSIANNITFGEEINTEKINNLFGETNIFNYILDLEENLNTKINTVYHSDGKNFSKGEMQKINLLKFLYQEASLKILDEANSNLDINAEQFLYKKIFDDDSIVLIITHRFFDMMKMDKIIFMSEDTIHVSNHEKLLNESEVYRNMYENYANRYKN